MFQRRIEVMLAMVSWAVGPMEVMGVAEASPTGVGAGVWGGWGGEASR